MSHVWAAVTEARPLLQRRWGWLPLLLPVPVCQFCRAGRSSCVGWACVGRFCSACARERDREHTLRPGLAGVDAGLGPLKGALAPSSTSATNFILAGSMPDRTGSDGGRTFEPLPLSSSFPSCAAP